MSEEELIKILNSYTTDLYHSYKEDVILKAIRGLLDLYNKEKKKNKELQKQANELVEQYEKELTEKNNYIFNLENEREALHKIIDKEFE